MKKITFITVLLLTALFLLVSNPVSAEDTGRAVRFDSVVAQTKGPLKPLLESRNITIENATPGAMINPDDGKTSEKFTSLLLNAVSGAPESARIIVSYDENSSEVKAALPDKTVRFEVEREVQDPYGNIFKIQSGRDLGMVFSFHLKPL